MKALATQQHYIYIYIYNFIKKQKDILENILRQSALDAFIISFLSSFFLLFV